MGHTSSVIAFAPNTGLRDRLNIPYFQKKVRGDELVDNLPIHPHLLAMRFPQEHALLAKRTNHDASSVRASIRTWTCMNHR